MKLQSTKLNIGDSLWSMSSNRPVEWNIKAIRCYITNNCCDISYELCKAGDAKFETSINEKSIGYNFFESKQELMANLFGDCLTEGLVVK